MTVDDKLKALGIQLPPLATPAAAYVPFVRQDRLVFLSGHIARKEGKPWVGQLGNDTGRRATVYALRWASRALVADFHGLSIRSAVPARVPLSHR